MTSNELYSKGARVWIPHSELVWEGAEVVQNYASGVLKVRTGDGKIKDLSASSEEQLPPLRNPDISIGENDLTSLSCLHEPAVLYNLQVRFCRQNNIYTYCGIVLVAINPYQELPIYDTNTILAYRGQSMGDMNPHIFAVAEEAYKKMEREQKDQSIIVSGESGAGKTVSAKYAMRYFATVGGSTTETHVERKVLASSPIMEAIGNAKTTRNDNSSRFGKYTELQFSSEYNIIGASMRTYLLEKSRVVFQAPGERNYHIFYQLCASRDQYHYLNLGEASTFRYLNQESIIPEVDDAQCFQETVSALVTLRFSERQITDIFLILASILHLGNIEIKGSSDFDDCSITDSDSYLQIFSHLLSINSKDLRKWLCVRRIASRAETFEKPMTLLESLGARDALAKYIYAELFSWIVESINRTLGTSSATKHKFIGVLDIYGFETFQINSFEQFCINYANEKLQQQFNQHVFKLEQEEYLKEDIEWKFIDFYDNQPCIDLIEANLGILDILDDECKMPKWSDASFVVKLYSKCVKWPHFSKPKFGGDAFVIQHFAGKVEYRADGFLKKNRDTVIEEQVEVLRGGNNQLLQQLFQNDNRLLVAQTPRTTVPRTEVSIQVKSRQSLPATFNNNTASLAKNKKTVGSQFRSSLKALMSTLNATTPHYIRCINPNDEKQAFEYNPMRAVEQLRACGVLETIRISAAGFPSRWSYKDFLNRYRVLYRSQDINRDNMRSTCECVLLNFIKGSDKFKFGKTKIFFRAGQVAHLEKLRSERLRVCCVLMQKTVRGFIHRKRYLRVSNAILTLQRVARGYLGRRRVIHLRRTRAAICIQKHMRGWICRVRYQQLICLAIGLQCHIRGLLARRRFMYMKYERAALVIQKNIRAWICRKRYRKKMRQVIVAQNAVRRFLARRKLKQLKKEARTVQHHVALNKGLENKIISLQQHIGELTKENSALKSVNSELNETRAKLVILRGADLKLKKCQLELNEQGEKLQQVVSTMELERNEKMDLLIEKENLVNKLDTEKEMLNKENKELREMVQLLNEKINKIQKNAEEKNQMLKEHGQVLDNYQKVVCEKNDLESRCEMLERELEYLKSEKVGNHNRSSSDPSSLLDYNLATVNNELPDEPQELEIGNCKIKRDLMEFIAKAVPRRYAKELFDHFKAQDVELVRLRDECVQLRSVLSNQTQGLKSIASSNDAANDVQKKITRQLEDELQSCQMRWSIEREELVAELTKLRDDRDTQRLLAAKMSHSPPSPSEVFMQQEISRLTNENLELHEKYDLISEQYRTLKKQFKDLISSMKVAGVTKLVGNQVITILEDIEVPSNRPIVRKIKRKYNGMFVFKNGEEDKIMKHLVIELKPQVAVMLPPGLPAYIMFMCVRHTDFTNEEVKLKTLLTKFVVNVKKVLNNKADDLELKVLWLSNTLRLLHTMKQYSGEHVFKEENTATQNEHCLKNLDLLEYRTELSDLAIWIYMTIVRFMKKKLSPKVVPAILKHDAANSSSAGRRRSGSVSSTMPLSAREALTSLKNELASLHRMLTLHGVDHQIILQVFKQLFYYICASSLNMLLLNKELCHWSKGMNIRSNLNTY